MENLRFLICCIIAGQFALDTTRATLGAFADDDLTGGRAKISGKKKN